jgi:HAD superfamily hydrolase (TIGR01490 family)
MAKLALFDFDHTLITGDSFLPFLIHAAGKTHTALALVETVAALATIHVKGEKQETRNFVKARLIKRLLAGQKRDELRAAAQKNREWQIINTPIMNCLHKHHAAGTKIVIASGGLNLYLPEMLRDVPHDALICTDIGVVNGIVTGDMINGNCVRRRKAERVAEWLAAYGPFDETFGYGNYPHDVPMLNLVKHRILVS